MELKGYIFAILVGIGWGTVGLFFAEMSKYNMGVYDIITARMLFAFIAGIIHIIYTKGIKELKISLGSLKTAALMGIVAQGLVNVFLFLSIEKSGVIVATLLMSLGPVFTLIFSRILYKEKLNKGKINALILTAIGTIILVTNGSLINLEFNFLGVIYGLLSGICFGLYPIISKSISGNNNPNVVMIYSFIIVVIMLLPFLNVRNFTTYHKLTANFLISVLFAIVPTLLCHLLFIKSLNYISATKAGIITLLQIPAATMFGIMFLNEQISIWKIIGIILIIIGILLIKMQDKEKN